MNAISPYLIEGEFKASLSKEIQTEYNKLAAILAQIPTEYRKVKLLEGTGGQISVADLVAYQIGWGSLLISWYDKGIKGEMPDMPGEGFTQWDYVGLARHFYVKYRYSSWSEAAKKFYTVVQRILDIVEKEYAAGNLDKKGVWAWCTLSSGKEWPLNKWVRVNTASPYRKAAATIRKFLKQLDNELKNQREI